MLDAAAAPIAPWRGIQSRFRPMFSATAIPEIQAFVRGDPFC